jgi:hypothetical protein
MTSTRLRPLVALVPAAAIVVAACGVPTGDDSFEQIGADDVPFRLAEPSTTTTSTTTPPTTQPAEPATTLVETTTTTPTETVQIYFLSRGDIRPVELPVAAGYGSNDLESLLEAGPDDLPGGDLLDTEIEEGLILGSFEQDGIVTIDLDGRIFDRIPRRDQRDAIAQIVMTFVDNLRRVGLAQFTIDDEPTDVPKGNNLQSDGPVSYDDYANLLADAPPSTAETTTTSTAVPDPDSAADTTAAP